MKTKQAQFKEIISWFSNDSISGSEDECIRIDHGYRKAEDNLASDLFKSTEGFGMISRDDWMATELYSQLHIIGRIASTTKDRIIEIIFFRERSD